MGDDSEFSNYNCTNDSNGTISAEDPNFRIVGLYIPLAFRPVLTILVIYLSLSAIDAILTTRKRHPLRFDSIEYFFLNNLLISDIVTVLFNNVAALFVILNTVVNPDTKGVKCYVIAASRSPTCATSLFVTLVCFDRMMFITHHHCYVRFMTKKRRYITVSIVWMLAIIGNVVIVFDPTMEDVTKNGVCIHRPFINHYGTIVLLLPAFLSVIVVIVHSTYLFYTVYQSNKERDQQLDLSGTTADMDTNQNNRRQSLFQNRRPSQVQNRRQSQCQDRRPSQFMRVLKMSRKSAYTAILLVIFHLIFGAVFPLIEYLVCPRFKGVLLYVILTSVVFVTFEFINLMIHPLLYGFYVNLIRENLRHRVLYEWIYQMCCCRLFPRYRRR